MIISQFTENPMHLMTYHELSASLDGTVNRQGGMAP